MAEMAFDGDYIRSRYGDDPVVVRFLDKAMKMRAILTAFRDWEHIWMQWQKGYIDDEVYVALRAIGLLVGDPDPHDLPRLDVLAGPMTHLDDGRLQFALDCAEMDAWPDMRDAGMRAEYLAVLRGLVAARAVLRRLEWSYDSQWCPICEAGQCGPHKPDCALAALLNGDA